MSARFQSWLLANTKGLQYIVNERLATRGGAIGRFFKALEIGQRQYGQHTLGRSMKVINFWWMSIYQYMAMMRPVLSRFIGVNQGGPLNFSALYVWFFCTCAIFSRFNFTNAKDVLYFNAQDNPEFWYSRYNMMFPPSFLHNRLSAHYIEINHIYAVEMMKRYNVARREILAERDTHSDFEKRTRYATNPTYVCEPLGEDAPAIQRMKDDGTF